MNKNNYTSLVLTLFILLCSLSSTAQSWQWGRRGGGHSDGQNLLPYEDVADMAVDKNGNVYVLSIIESSGSPDINGSSLVTYGSRDILVSSFNCNGSYRWSKVIGGGGADRDARAIGVDTLGHVYVTGQTISVQTGTQCHFDTDTILGYTNKKSMFLIQYDTSGVLQWFRQAAPDTTTGNNSPTMFRSYDMQVTGNGDVYLLCYFSPGLLSGPGGMAINTAHPYILKYNSQGTIMALITPDLNFTSVSTTNPPFTATQFSSIRLTRTKSGRFYVSGTQNVQSSTSYITMGSQSIPNSMFIGAFDNQGQFLWKKDNDTSYGGFYYRPVLDDSDNIFLAGGAPSFGSFNGYSFQNPLGLSGFPFVMKMDSSADLKWVKSGGSNAATYGFALALKNNNELILTGSYPLKLVWDNFKLENPTNTGYDIYIARFNKSTGAVLGIDSIQSNTGYDDYSSCMVADGKGSVYIGGRFGSQLPIAGTTLGNAGGSTDFFVARYGVPCNCTVPVSSFTYTGNVGHTLSFTFTGTTPSDSVVWNFGDNTPTVKQQSPTHTYTLRNSYNVCATVYTACGSQQYCQTIAVATSVASLQQLNELSVYPNPATDVVNISGGKDLTARLYSITGQLLNIYELHTATEQIDVSRLPAGSYLLELVSREGLKRVVKLMK